MIEPNDILFPELDAAMASFPGFETEGTFRGWLRNSVTNGHTPGDDIHLLIDDDSAWPIVYRLASMSTAVITLKEKPVALGDTTQIEVIHEVKGEYSYGIGPAVMSVWIEGMRMERLLDACAKLVNIREFILFIELEKSLKETDDATDSDGSASDEAESETALAVEPDNTKDEDGQNADAVPDNPAGEDSDAPHNNPDAQEPVDVDQADPVPVPVQELPPEEEPKPKPKTTRAKKVTTNEPSGDGGEATHQDPDAVRGETGDVPPGE